MTPDARPIVVAFDGSSAAQAALRRAVELFGDRTLLVVSVWEPGLAMAAMTLPDTTGVYSMGPSLEQIAHVDGLQREHATAIAQAGAELARGLGATARAWPVRDEADVAAAVVSIAEEQDAAAVVVGSRGMGAARSRLLGSTSRKLLHDARRPVVVVRATF